MMDAVQKMVDFTKNNGNPYQMMLRKPSADQNNRGKSTANMSVAEVNRRGGKLPVTMATSPTIETPTTPKSIPLSIMPKIKSYVNPIAITKRPTSMPDLSQLNPKLLPNRLEKVKSTQNVVDSIVDPTITTNPTADPVLLVNSLGETRAAPIAELAQINGIRGNNRFTIKPPVINLSSTSTTKPSSSRFENTRPTQLPPVSAKLPQYQPRKPLIPAQPISLENSQLHSTVSNEDHIPKTVHANTQMLGRMEITRFPKRPSLMKNYKTSPTANIKSNTQDDGNTRIAVVENTFDDKSTVTKDVPSRLNVLEKTISRTPISAEAIKPTIPAPSRGDQGVDEYEADEELTSIDNPADSVFELARLDDSVKPNLRTVVAKETAPIDILRPQLKQSDTRAKYVLNEPDAVEQINKQRLTNVNHPIINQDYPTVVIQPQEISNQAIPISGLSGRTSLAENINNIFDALTNTDNEDDSNITDKPSEKGNVSNAQSTDQKFISNLSEISSLINLNPELKSTTKSTAPSDQNRIRAKISNLPTNLANLVEETTGNLNVVMQSNAGNAEKMLNTNAKSQNNPSDLKPLLSGNLIGNIKNVKTNGNDRNGNYNFLLPPNKIMAEVTTKIGESVNNHTVVEHVNKNKLSDEVNVKISITQNDISLAKTDNSEIKNPETSENSKLSDQTPRARLAIKTVNPPISEVNQNIQENVRIVAIADRDNITEEIVNSGEGELINHTSRTNGLFSQKVLNGELSSKLSGKQLSKGGEDVQKGNTVIIKKQEKNTDINAPAPGQYVFTGDGNILAKTTRERLDRPPLFKSELVANVNNGEEYVISKININNVEETTLGDTGKVQHVLGGHLIDTSDEISKLQINVDAKSILPSVKSEQLQQTNPIADINPNVTGENVYTGEGNLISQTNRKRLNNSEPEFNKPKEIDSATRLNNNQVIKQTVDTDEDISLSFTASKTIDNQQPSDSAIGQHVFSGEGNILSHTGRNRLNNGEFNGKLVQSGEGNLLNFFSKQSNGTMKVEDSPTPTDGEHVFSGEGNLQSHTSRTRLNNAQPNLEIVASGEGNLLSHTYRNNIENSRQENSSADSDKIFSSEGNIPSKSTRTDSHPNGQIVQTGEGNLLGLTSKDAIGTQKSVDATESDGVFNGEGNIRTGKGNLLSNISLNNITKNDDKSAPIFSGEGNLQRHTTRTQLENSQPSGQVVNTGEGNLLSHTLRNKINETHKPVDSEQGQHVFSGEGNLQSHTNRYQLNNNQPNGEIVHSGEGNLLSHNSRSKIGTQRPEDSTTGHQVFSGEGNLQSHTTRTRLNNNVGIQIPDDPKHGQHVFSGEGNLLSHTTRTRLDNNIAAHKPEDANQGQHVFSAKGNLQSHTTRTQLTNKKPSGEIVYSGESDLLSHISRKKTPQLSSALPIEQNVPTGDVNLLSLLMLARNSLKNKTPENISTGEENLLSLINRLETLQLEEHDDVFSGKGNLVSQSKVTRVENKKTSPSGTTVYSGEGNLISKTLRTSFKFESPDMVENNSEFLLQPIIIPSLDENIDQPKELNDNSDNKTFVDNKSASRDCLKPNSLENKPTIHEVSITTDSQTIHQAGKVEKKTLLFNEYLPIRGLPSLSINLQVRISLLKSHKY